MANLSANEIAGIIKYYNAGGPSPIAPITDRNAVIAIAVALAESSGNPQAVGGPNSNGTRDWGLWQINDIHNPSQAQKTSAAANWLYAWRIAGMGTSWKPWATFNSGKYKDHEATARAAWASAKPAAAGSLFAGAEMSSDATSTDILPAPFGWLSPLFNERIWLRIGMAAIGVLLLALVAGAILKSASPIGQLQKLIKAKGKP